MKNTFNKILFLINLVFYLIVLVIPIYEKNIISGLFYQFYLGIFQLILGVYFLSLKRPKKVSNNLGYYWTTVITYFITLPIFSSLLNNEKNFINVCLVIIPMIIGLYHIYINYLIKKT